MVSPLPNFSVEESKKQLKKFLICMVAKPSNTHDRGYDPLREWIAEDARKDGLNITKDNILITTGSQQALDFVGRIFINQGDRVLTESPTYLGALQAWNTYGPTYVTVDTDENGLVTDNLEDLIRQNVKFMYVLPIPQSLGVTMSIERRKRLIELANKYNVP